MHDDHRFVAAMRASGRFIQNNQYERALRVLDDAIAIAIRENQKSPIVAMCRRAAIICRLVEDLEREREYHERSLENAPENATGLYGLADVARRSGQIELARALATRCYKALLQDEDLPTRDSLLDSLVKHWPEIVATDTPTS